MELAESAAIPYVHAVSIVRVRGQLAAKSASRRVAIVEAQQPAEPLAALHRTCSACLSGIRLDELTTQPLMMTLAMIMLDEAFEGLAQMPLSQWHDLVETL